jgi:parvulin-like peptidyl-prolyl isomerase
MSFNRWSSIVLCILTLVSFAGCGGSTDGTSRPVEGAETPGAPDPGSVLTNTPEISGLIKAEDPDAVVASVNGESITAKQVTELAQTNKIRLRAQGMNLPEGADQELMRAALQMLIDAELMIQQAREEGIEIGDDEIEAEIQAARAQFASEEEFAKYLRDAGVTEDDVHEEAERRVLMRAYQALVAEGQTVDDAMAREVYDANPELFTAGEQVRAAHILVSFDQDDPPAKKEEARERIDEAHVRLDKGEDFAELAKEFSQATTAAKGGDLGFFPRGVMVPMLEEVAFRTPVGEFSPVFETIYGYNILKVLDKREPELKPFEEVKPLLMVELARMKQSQAVQAKLLELRNDADIEILDEDLGPAPEEPEAEAAAVTE